MVSHRNHCVGDPMDLMIHQARQANIVRNINFRKVFVQAGFMAKSVQLKACTSWWGRKQSLMSMCIKPAIDVVLNGAVLHWQVHRDQNWRICGTFFISRSNIIKLISYPLGYPITRKESWGQERKQKMHKVTSILLPLPAVSSCNPFTQLFFKSCIPIVERNWLRSKCSDGLKSPTAFHPSIRVAIYCQSHPTKSQTNSIEPAVKLGSVETDSQRPFVCVCVCLCVCFN